MFLSFFSCVCYTEVKRDYTTCLTALIPVLQMLSSGWIVEPVRKDKKLYSLVTYLMQVDYGPAKTGDHLPFEDMMCRHPMSISYLQQYLKPAVQLARRKSAPLIAL